MRVLVTGGAGFIGSHIVDALRANGHEPFVLDNLVSGSRDNLPADVPLYEADICDEAAVTRIFNEVRPELVCHQAAQMSVSRSVREPVFDAEVNIVGLLRVLENAARVGARRFVFASSGGALYGEVGEPAAEDHPCDPISPYGLSKWVGEQYMKFYARERGLQCVALRYSNVYGPRQNPHGEAGVVAIFSQKLLAGEQPTIFGDGSCVRDYVYVGDVARANLRALERDHASNFLAVNIGTAIGTDVNELADFVRTSSEQERRKRGLADPLPTPQHAAPRAGDLQCSKIDPRLAATELAWQPRTTLSEGLRETVEWFADHRTW